MHAGYIYLAKSGCREYKTVYKHTSKQKNDRQEEKEKECETAVLSAAYLKVLWRALRRVVTKMCTFSALSLASA